MTTTRRLAAPIASGAALLAVVLALNACSGVTDALRRQAEITYDTRAQAEGDWGPGELPAWIPDGSTDIRRLMTDNGAEQVVRVATDGELPAACTPKPRKDLPFETRDWIPDVVQLDRIHRCGDWEVTPVDDGYVAWFSARAKGQLPEG